MIITGESTSDTVVVIEDQLNRVKPKGMGENRRKIMQKASEK